MSGRACYRVMVRMLYDPPLADAVYSGREDLLRDGLTAQEIEWLVQPDRRAYGTDPGRRQRSLTVALEEFPAASAFVLRRGIEGSVKPEIELLDAFFSSEIFHRCIQDGGSMVLAYGEYLEGPAHGGVEADPRIRTLARIESAIARVRRVESALGGNPSFDAASPAVPRMLRLAPDKQVLTVPLGGMELYTRVSRALRAHKKTPMESLLNPRWSLPVLMDPDSSGVEYLLAERLPGNSDGAAAALLTGQENGTAGALLAGRQDGRIGAPPSGRRDGRAVEVGVAPITPELGGLLMAAVGGCEERHLAGEARRLGAEPGEETEILESLIRERLLVIP